MKNFIDELSAFTHGRIQAQCEKVEDPTRKRRKRDTDTVVAGLVIATRSKNLSSGGKMGFATLDDRSGRLDIVIGAELYQSSSALLVKDTVLVVCGDLGYDDFSGGYRVRAKQVMDINAARQRFARQLVVDVDSSLFSNGFLDKFQETITPYTGGDCTMVVKYSNETARVPLVFGDAWRIKPCGELLEKIDALEDRCSARLAY